MHKYIQVNHKFFVEFAVDSTPLFIYVYIYTMGVIVYRYLKTLLSIAKCEHYYYSKLLSLLLSILQPAGAMRDKLATNLKNDS